MFGTKILIDKLNTAINSGTLEELEIVQALGAIESLEKHPVSSVATSADLPNPVTNKGRFFWIENEQKYTFSNGVSWNINSIIQQPYVNGWTFGVNAAGQLGDNTIVDKSSPVSVAGGFTDWVQLSASVNHSLGLRANGSAWAWGNNTGGRLGDNTTTTKSSPVSVVGGGVLWTQLSAGNYHSLGLRADGTAWAWGNGGNGRLGDNTGVSKTSPVSVVGGGVLWVQLSAGYNHSLGVRADGTAWAWGSNSSLQLGDGTSTSKSSPVSVIGGFTDWVQVSAGGIFSLGLRADGTAWAWGRNAAGVLGNNSTTPASILSPVSVVGGFTDWIQLSAGSNHSLGLRANGTAWAWGNNTSGRLGDGTATQRSSPVSVVGGFTDWIQVSGGTSHSVAVRSNGVAFEWGVTTASGVVSSSSPVSIVGGFTDWVQMDGGTHTAGIRG